MNEENGSGLILLVRTFRHYIEIEKRIKRAKERTVGAEAAAARVGLSVLAVHTVACLGNDKSIRVHDRDDVERVLFQVSCHLLVLAIQQLRDHIPIRKRMVGG